jgi:hypothetical protein
MDAEGLVPRKLLDLDSYDLTEVWQIWTGIISKLS